jgi:Bacteriophage translational regulator
MLNLNELIEVTLKSPDDFLKVKETLSRIGVASRKDKTLYQSCHILHKQGKYYILHFKELFLLDGKQSDFSEDDRARLNTIANLLAEWDLVDLVYPEKSSNPVASLSQIKILSHKEKGDWNLVTKYNIGKKKKVE